jgi:hypothetical protein
MPGAHLAPQPNNLTLTREIKAPGAAANQTTAPSASHNDRLWTAMGDEDVAPDAGDDARIAMSY